MILVDSSVWIDHLRRREARLARLLEEDMALTHPWILGELALGSMANRERILGLLGRLPNIRPAADEAIRELIETERLYGRGIGWVDAGLLASCRARQCRLWSRDKRLAALARELGLGIDAD